MVLPVGERHEVVYGVVCLLMKHVAGACRRQGSNVGRYDALSDRLQDGRELFFDAFDRFRENVGLSVGAPASLRLFKDAFVTPAARLASFARRGTLRAWLASHFELSADGASLAAPRLLLFLASSSSRSIRRRCRFAALALLLLLLTIVVQFVVHVFFVVVFIVVVHYAHFFVVRPSSAELSSCPVLLLIVIAT